MQDIKQFAAQQAALNGLNPQVFLAQIAQESGWKADAVSSAGARGLGQLMPSTAKELGVKNVNDPYENVAASARYMGMLKNQFGTEDLARLAYNWGSGNVASYLKTGKGIKGQPIPQEAAEYNPRIYSKAGTGSNDAMAMMASYKPRREYATQQAAPMSIAILENELLSNPKQVAKQAFMDDMVESVAMKDPYTADLEMQLSKMFDDTEILPKEYMNG